MTVRILIAALAALAVLAEGCLLNARSGDEESAAEPQGFGEYWYRSKAEISRYRLEQARYGQIREGHTVLIFVTEDFLAGRQVKLEGPPDPGATSVLKLNQVRKFTTGIYDYSMMSSVFTPVDRRKFPHSLKLTASSQEWCGHTWLQLNRREDDYMATSFSYFEQQGDEAFNTGEAWLEDELFTLIRIDPGALPVGRMRMIPSAFASRLRHRRPAAEDAVASRADGAGAGEAVYNVEYPDSDRKLSIVYEKKFPHRILRWEDSYPDGFGKSPAMLTTRATLTHSVMEPYWRQNEPADTALRGKLGL